jgi:preprotein translocase SecE subunit
MESEMLESPARAGKPAEKPYRSLLDIARQHRTQTHLETGEIASKISREIVPGTTLTVSDELSRETFSYEIRKQLGVGSFGVVYQGVDIQDPEKKTLAIKIEPYATLTPCMEPLIALRHSISDVKGLVRVYAAGRVEKMVLSNPPRVRQKLSLSPQAMSSLRRFLRINQSIETEGEVYLGCLVMEYINGRSLSSIVEAARSQTESDAEQRAANSLRLLQIVIDASIAIARLHRRGFVHCDLHPRNILVTETGVKVIDYTCVKRIGEHSGRVSHSVYTPLDYAQRADQITDGKGIADYVDVYPLAAALYDALVDKPDFQTKYMVFYDENKKPIGRLPRPVKTYAKLDQISPPGLGQVIRAALLKEHPGLADDPSESSMIQKGSELAAALLQVFRQEYQAWLNRTETEISIQNEEASKRIQSLEEELNGDQQNRWEDFSVWWADETEKEHVQREQWAEDQLQWIQQEYYQEAVRRERARLRRTMFPALLSEIQVSLEDWLATTKSLETKRAQDLHKTREKLYGYQATHRRTVEVSLKQVTEREMQRWNAHSANPLRVLGENLTFVYWTIALAISTALRPFTRAVRETIGELRKVTWPTWAEAWTLTRRVLLMILFWGTLSGLIDYFMKRFLAIVMGY